MFQWFKLAKDKISFFSARISGIRLNNWNEFVETNMELIPFAVKPGIQSQIRIINV